MSYIDEALDAVSRHVGEDEDRALLRYYALLALTTGQSTSLADVHDAWALWTAEHRGMTDHANLRPFGELAEATQEQDLAYQLAIHAAAAELGRPT